MTVGGELKKLSKFRFIRFVMHRYAPWLTGRGASVIEVALTLPIFFLLVFGFIDIARYFFVYMGLNYAAHLGADYAAKIPIEIDISSSNTACDPAIPDDECDEYVRRVRSVLQRATNAADLVASTSANASAAQLVRFIHYNSPPYPPGSIAADVPTTGIEGDAAFLRPGERVKRTDQFGGGYLSYEFSGNYPKFVDSNPSIPGPGTPGWPGAGQSWRDLLSDFPVMVRVESIFGFFTPFLPDTTIQGTQYGYRRIRKSGKASPPLPPPATFTPPPPPTWTITQTPTPPPPTFTPTMTGTPTQTGTSTATGTKTATGTATGTPTQTGTATNTGTVTPTKTPTNTKTSTSTPTPTPTGPTPTPSNTKTPTMTKTATHTKTATATATTTGTPTWTATITATPTESATPTASPTPTMDPRCNLCDCFTDSATADSYCCDGGNPNSNYFWCFNNCGGANQACTGGCCGIPR